MIFDPVARTLTLGKKDCGVCNINTPVGKVFGQKVCVTCKGTGRGPRGKHGGCRPCFGRGSKVDLQSFVDCPVCHGAPEAFQDETWCDSAPSEATESLPVVVVRQDHAGTFNEGYLGLGCLWSVTDSGTAWDRPDSATLAKVLFDLDKERVQALNLIDDRGSRNRTEPLVEKLVIVITRSGYSIRPSKREVVNV